MTQNDFDTEMQRHVMCAPGKDTRPAKEQAKRGQMDREHGIVEKELMNGQVAREMTEGRKEARTAPRAANPIGTATRIKEAREKARARAKARVKPDTAESRGTSE